ncbi:TipC family immunity protein [Streptococcus sp. CSL10205-OR2]|uniref:TipC family immunity protein n=1 Tax=Streptococcus sp. CSL10205-OR2 TaxID=2980558 RepID=UPI0021DA1BAD|nr:TipC family immunity protein [Streptococcus sp. CSL10205-OR2]MCU9534075.1 TipC family immunity protein [Streptococcus sp. CSL10205-OR2]
MTENFQKTKAVKKDLMIVLGTLLSLAAIITFFVLLNSDKIEATRVQNIFDEMYYEVKVGNRKSVFHSFNDVAVDYLHAHDEEMNDTRNKEPYVTYYQEILPHQYTYARIYFQFFHKTNNGVGFSFQKELTDGTIISIYAKYNKKASILKKDVIIILEQGQDNTHLREESAIKAYLKEHDISAKELDNIYDELMNDKILTDWTKLYDSQYSPSDYGNVKVVTQWEDW